MENIYLKSKTGKCLEFRHDEEFVVISISKEGKTLRFYLDEEEIEKIKQYLNNK